VSGHQISKLLKALAVGFGILGASAGAGAQTLEIGGKPAEIAIAPVSNRTLRVTIAAIDDAAGIDMLRKSTVLALEKTPMPAARIRSIAGPRVIRTGGLQVRISPSPLTLHVSKADGKTVQEFQIDAQTGAVQFDLGKGPIYGLGQGGPQFGRTGSNYQMANLHSGYNQPYFGGRLPIPWLLSTDGWALFVHNPEGSIDLSQPRGKFTPATAITTSPLDFFVVSYDAPAEAMSEYARLTGSPTMPPLWTLGYQQSHRTVESRDVIFNIARNFREKKLPCDALIYLGTGWCPSGWNTGHASFQFNGKVFPDPPADIRHLEDEHFKVVLHVVFPPKDLHGKVGDHPAPADQSDAANYWKLHLPVFNLGIDGWWPDAGEELNREARLARIRMYWEGPQLERPDVRPYALHRTGYAGMQRFGGWLWTGDVNSTWETLRNHIPIGLNTGLSGVPFWGSDIGGFYSTKELTGELYVRWFEFGSFCPLFRSHGRPSRTRFPWGWNTGEIGEPELSPNVPGTALPELSELHNPQIEPICKKYLELRYRMLPYIYTIARETHDTGIPMMRPLWMHYADDPNAASQNYEYLWGRDILVAPVFEKAASSRRLYLPRGAWYDFWTSEKIDGGREVAKAVDLGTMPLYVRAGAIIPLSPLKQYTAEKVDGPLAVTVYPGADGRFALYDDDGISFKFGKGDYARIVMNWSDKERTFTVALERGTKLQSAFPRTIDVRLASGGDVHHIAFDGSQKSVRFR
jgi:alpha-glucosidase/alpha-D-xyloside xylohydrolase